MSFEWIVTPVHPFGNLGISLVPPSVIFPRNLSRCYLGFVPIFLWRFLKNSCWDNFRDFSWNFSNDAFRDFFKDFFSEYLPGLFLRFFLGFLLKFIRGFLPGFYARLLRNSSWVCSRESCSVFCPNFLQRPLLEFLQEFPSGFPYWAFPEIFHYIGDSTLDSFRNSV